MTGVPTTAEPEDEQLPWSAEALRLTLFPVPGESLNISWEDTVGEPPESSQQQPRIKTGIEVGPLGAAEAGRTLEVQTNPFQTNWVIGSRTGPGEEALRADSPMEMSGAVDALRQLAARIFKMQPRVTRMAFGAQLRQSTETQSAAYRLIPRYLPFEPDAKRSSDFIYQINFPRPSGSVEGITINRLSQWAVVTTSSVLISVDGSDAPLTGSKELISVALQVTLDINNSPNRGELPVDSLEGLFEEMLTAGLEICAKGAFE